MLAVTKFLFKSYLPNPVCENSTQYLLLEPFFLLQTFDIVPAIHMCTLDIIYESIMGHSVDAQHKSDGAEYAEAVSRYMDIFSDRTVI